VWYIAISTQGGINMLVGIIVFGLLIVIWLLVRRSSRRYYKWRESGKKDYGDRNTDEEVVN